MGKCVGESKKNEENEIRRFAEYQKRRAIIECESRERETGTLLPTPATLIFSAEMSWSITLIFSVCFAFCFHSQTSVTFLLLQFGGLLLFYLCLFTFVSQGHIKKRHQYKYIYPINFNKLGYTHIIIRNLVFSRK